MNETGETLLAASTIRMFGREFGGLTMNLAGTERSRIDPARHPKLARIYGFSFQGNYFKLSAPTILLVYGDGTLMKRDMQGATLGEIGIEFKDEFFAGDVWMWTALELDFSVRIDISSGWLSEILIAPEATEASNVTGTGDGSTDGRNRVVGRAAMSARHAMMGRPPNS